MTFDGVVRDLFDEAPPVFDHADAPADLDTTAQPNTTIAFTFADAGPTVGSPSGLASFDVRLTRQESPTTDYSWSINARPATSPTLTLTEPVGLKVCASARARDWYGNLSDWTRDVCTTARPAAPTPTPTPTPVPVPVPDALPLVTSTIGSPLYLATLGGSVIFTAHGSDAEGPVSYEVRSRTAGPGLLLGPWKSEALPAGTSSVSRRVGAGSQVCLSARAVDGARQVSGWSAERCTATPVDDRALAMRGRGARTRSSLAVGGTVAELRARGASLALSTKVVGRSVAIWVVKAPGQGGVDVQVGTRRVGHIDLRASSPRRQMVSFALPTAGGNVSLVSTSGRPARIDAVTNLR